MALDRNSEYLGVSTLQLMENAGRSVTDEIAARFGRGSAVTVYAGTGKNGGDGAVAARHLASRGFKVTYRLVGDELSIADSTSLQNWKAVKRMCSSIKIEKCRDSTTLSESHSDVVVDALLGTGVRGKLRQPMLRAVEVINRSGGFKVAIDVPSGIDADTGEVLGEAVRANLTVTFHGAKRGFSKAKDYCGEIKVVDIGIPPEASFLVGPGDVDLVTVRRSPDAHKGEFGRLLVIGGSEMFTGAPALVALAAYRTGADLVFVAAPENTAQAISTISPDLITIKLPGKNLSTEHLLFLREQIVKASAIALGPGLGLSKKTVLAVKRIVEFTRKEKKPILLDADGLNAMGLMKLRVFDGAAVVTPHAGEFQAISGKLPSKDLTTRSTEVTALASKCGAVVLLKGHTDVISDGVRTKLNNTGNPGMTVGGTGDVLSGIVAGLLAQRVDAFSAAAAGSFVNGAAGDLAEEQYGYHLTATDLIEHIPKVLNDPMCHKAIMEKRLR
jgi:NAD(P)H-hydrate epimerase